MASFSSFRHLRRLSTSAKPSISLSKAKSQLSSEHDPDKAIAIYSSVSDQNSSLINSRYALEITVRRLAKSERFSDIETLIESHKANPKIREEPYLSFLIRSYVRAGMLDHGMKTFEEMEALGTPRSSFSYNALLSSCCSVKLFDKVLQLFDEIPKRYKISPDEFSYGVLIKAYCGMGLIDKALETMEEMERNGISVNVVIFTTVIDTLYEKGEAKEAEKLWAKMVSKGVEANVVAYNVRIRHCNEGKPENVKALMEEMTNSGLKPDTISYNYLMTCYFESGLNDEARKLYNGLEKLSLNPNAATFKTMVHYLCRDEDFERAYKVFKKSAETNKIPDFDTVRVLVEGLVKKKKIKEAKGMIRTLKKKFPVDSFKPWVNVEKELGLVSGGVSDDEEANTSDF